jgi:hypothetical protein
LGTSWRIGGDGGRREGVARKGGPSQDVRKGAGPLREPGICPCRQSRFASVQGTSDVTFNATDPGAGVWEVTFSVDGKVVQSTVPDENDGHCRDVGQSTDGLAAFDYLQPCPPVESVDVGFDTTVVSNGEHHLVVSVLDPAGNSATVLDREIDVFGAGWSRVVRVRVGRVRVVGR